MKFLINWKIIYKTPEGDYEFIRSETKNKKR
ncbi:hypothetical protein HMPREF9724_01927 [Treponema denticola SP37]|nr:hypothetical protein HMPREF9724_01927 [Treponema denticola SP37]EPF32821.1 hypothetical protein HMPREF9734_02142 [Treponema denticola SP44]EPF40298.1 hypothetical protein HMPREF9731_00158 [Treponema denticola SP23]